MSGGFDHAASNVKRSFEPLEYTFGSTFGAHALTSNYLIPPEEVVTNPTEQIREYHSNNSVWEDNIILNRHYHGSRIKLESFFLFEWFPRSPGLYFTDEGRAAREEARSRIISHHDGNVVYNPYGKKSMLDGGVGNIRLNPIELRGQEWFFASASDNGVCHQGFPVALPSELYSRCIDEIRSRGAAVRTLIGELKLVPGILHDAYYGYAYVKKLYLQVSDIRPPEYQKSRTLADLDVSVAVSFEGEVDGKRDVYASYVTFDPGKPEELKRAVSWMGNKYVGAYNGTVLTDFDEQENHFPNARFSLNKVMQLSVTEREFKSVEYKIGNVENFIAFQEAVRNYNISGGNIGAVGDGAQAHNVNQFSQGWGRFRKFWPLKRR